MLPKSHLVTTTGFAKRKQPWGQMAGRYPGRTRGAKFRGGGRDWLTAQGRSAQGGGGGERGRDSGVPTADAQGHPNFIF